MTNWQPGMIIDEAGLNDDHPGPWANVNFVNWAQGALSYAPLRVQRDGSRARLDGHAQPTAAFTGGQVAFNIPPGFRPQYQRYYSVPRITSGTPTDVGVAIAVNGDVTIYSSTSITTTDRYDFSHVEWPLN
ncbi:hypothetical protein [Streptomyces sp. MMS20-AI2-20]|uniref:hypothetical protein n=1 Tax=Streptomyces TaxID=1883 RepID=UPI001F625AF5|nr:hypothetical protein [Streptomyces sp. MMS20-AI2-20]MCI4143065.1 hypothetical protein [Streptomyces sp. MMS20-AI2-20]